MTADLPSTADWWIYKPGKLFVWREICACGKRGRYIGTLVEFAAGGTPASFRHRFTCPCLGKGGLWEWVQLARWNP
jgi:hypothetical protein